jgi:hypothetical protein
MQAIDEKPSSPFLADGWEVSVDSGGSIETGISAHGAIASPCLIPPKQRKSHSCRRYRQEFDI